MRLGTLVLFSFLFQAPLANADVEILEAGEGIAFVDMGMDPATGAITLVGTEDGVAKVFYVSGDRMSFSSAVLVGLGPGTQVFGIAADGSRIAGVSKSPGSEDVGEGTTWLSSDSAAPVGIGFVGGSASSSVAVGAWSGAVVGDHTGGSDAVSWTPSTGLTVLPDGGTLSETFDVSADGSLVIGFASMGPCYWDALGFHLLNNPSGNLGGAQGIVPNAAYLGGDIDFLDFEPFDAGTQAAVWIRRDSDYELMLLTNPDSSRFKGNVEDVSDSGYAVGATSDDDAFLWHPSFDQEDAPNPGPQLLDDWLESLQPGSRPATPSGPAVAIAEEPATGNLFIAVASPARLIRVTTPDADSDGDGLSDSEEVALGTNPFAADSDGDGFDDGTEQALGTDPLDGASFFQATITGPDPAPGGGRQVTLTWPSKPGNRYAVETSTTLAAGSWQPLQTQTAEAGETVLSATIAILPADAPRMQFRIRFDGVAP